MSGFFGFGTDVPSLGSGKFDDLDGALPDDEDIDIVNDETFGAGAVFDGDWEETHEKLAEQRETFKYEGHHRSSSENDHGLVTTDYQQSDTFTTQEDDLEKSLSQLVVDDDEIDDPAIMNLSKNRPIPQAKNSNLDNLFGPSSPPAFLNTEHLVSPGKTNIWGSPVTRESCMDPSPKDDSGIKTLLNMLQSKTQAHFQDPSIVMAGKPPMLPTARSLDELEQEMIGAGKKNGRPLTVEELERELRGQPIPSPPGGHLQHQRHSHAPIGTPPQGGCLHQQTQRVSGNKPSVQSTSPGQPFSSSPHAPGYSHSTAPITIAKRGTPPSANFQAPRCHSPVFAALMRGGNLSPPPSSAQRLGLAPQVHMRISPSPPPPGGMAPCLVGGPSGGPAPLRAGQWSSSAPHPVSPLAALSHVLQPGGGVACTFPYPPHPTGSPAPLPPSVPPAQTSATLHSSTSPSPLLWPQASLGNGTPSPSPTTSPLSFSFPSTFPSWPASICSPLLPASYPLRPAISPTPWSLLSSPSSSHSQSPTTTGSITMTPTEVTNAKHRIAAALTTKLLASGMNGGTGSPAERQNNKNMPPFMSNQPVQQRMPFPAGFNDNRGGRGGGPHHHQGPPPRGHPMFNQNKAPFDPHFPGDRHHGERFQNGRHPGDRFQSGDRFPPGGPMDDRERYGPGPMDDRERYGPGHGPMDDRERFGPGPMDDRYGPGPGDRFPNGDFHARHPGDHHMDRGGRGGFGHMDRGGGRGGFGGRGRGFDGPMDHPGRGGFDMRMRGGPMDMRGRGGFDMRGRGRGGFHHGSPRWRQNSGGDDEDYEADGDRDVYSNLMTQKEKDWIIRIQLMQIHTNDPYLDDYYYTKWQMEKLIRERAAKAGSKGEPKLVLPQLAKADGRLYKPVQFEGSLGRLTASSVHNPRQIIDVRVKTNTGDEEGRHKEVRRFKQLLIHIEKSYDLLLVIDDVEKRAMALPEPARPPLYHERALRVHELYELLHLEARDDISFAQLLTVRKGTKLVARTVPFLGKEQALTVVAAILQSILTVIKRDLQDEVMAQLFEPVACVVAETALPQLVLLTTLLTTPLTDSHSETTVLIFMLQSKFGASLVWSIVSRGEAIFRTVSPVDMDVENQNSWTSFLQCLGEAALETPELAQPFYVFPTVPAYLRHHLGLSTYSTLETRLTTALTPRRDASPHRDVPPPAPVVSVAS